MAFTRGQVDRFGRPIPASPGYQVIINEDGSEIQQRNRLILPASIVASDSDDNDASELALNITPGDINPIAAHTVLGNNSASSAVPTAEPATAIGFGVLAAATQAALTALIALATNALDGLMSAAHFEKVEAAYDVVYSAAYSGVAFVAATWTAGKYRRIEIHIKNVSGGTTYARITHTGLTASGYYTFQQALNTATPSSASNQAYFLIDLTPGGDGNNSQIDIIAQIAKDGGFRTITGQATMSTGPGLTINGTTVDTTHDVSGVRVDFSANSTGWFEVIGYK